MSPTEQKVAIAKACGWKPDGVIHGIRHYPAFRHKDGRRVTQDNLPNYPVDLNAMHEAERTLLGSERRAMHFYIAKKFYRQEYDPEMCFALADAFSAPAAYRAEAFLHVLGERGKS